MASLIYLSPSKLALFSECPYCFWLKEVKGVKRPEGPSSKLPNRMDGLIKAYFDRYRTKGVFPPELQGKIPGAPLQDAEMIRKWRYWKTGPTYRDETNGYELKGALDECFVHDGVYAPADYKTRGSEVTDRLISLYQLQLDCYTLMLEAEGFKTARSAYLIFYLLDSMQENGQFLFSIKAYKIQTNPERASEVAAKAARFLGGPRPRRPADPSCSFCRWGIGFPDFD